MSGKFTLKLLTLQTYLAFLTTESPTVSATDFAGMWVKFIIDSAANIGIADAGNHFTGNTVEEALHFVPDERKPGGAYVTVSGRVRHISIPEKTLVMEDGTVILLDDIASLEIVGRGDNQSKRNVRKIPDTTDFFG